MGQETQYFFLCCGLGCGGLYARKGNITVTGCGGDIELTPRARVSACNVVVALFLLSLVFLRVAWWLRPVVVWKRGEGREGGRVR